MRRLASRSTLRRKLIRRLGVHKVVVTSLLIGMVGVLLLSAATSAGAIFPLLFIGMVLTRAGVARLFGFELVGGPCYDGCHGD
ncbi:hypothetical protein ABZ297_23930 [Nonomuraea sp. NPDC005983]|uniref:hypothetical protein n=1 Tax=Nonomuraea sp. NPDC005983 TaxID=3155595 RepID=UPI0033AE042E